MIPNGAGVEAVRRLFYFGSYDIGPNLRVIAAYAVSGIAVSLIGGSVISRRSNRQRRHKRSPAGSS